MAYPTALLSFETLKCVIPSKLITFIMWVCMYVHECACFGVTVRLGYLLYMSPASD